jgi:hypothetical protein
MNRIRKIKDGYQVLITPDIKIAPDQSLLIGNWSDEHLRNYHVLQFETLNDAQCEAYEYPDIDWYRLVLNHQHIFSRLESTLRNIIHNNNLSVEFRPTLMDPETLKNTMFDRVLRVGERFNMRSNMNDIINFTIINPWSHNLHTISTLLETYQAHLYRDDLRLRHKKVIDGKIICLYGITEFGTTYEIKLIPSLLQQWVDWYKKNGFRNETEATELYNKFMKQQQQLDSGPIVK